MDNSKTKYYYIERGGFDMLIGYFDGSLAQYNFRCDLTEVEYLSKPFAIDRCGTVIERFETFAEAVSYAERCL